MREKTTDMAKGVFDERGDFEPVNEFNEKLAQYVENPEEMRYVGTTAEEQAELEAMEAPVQRRSLASFHRSHRHRHSHHSHHSHHRDHSGKNRSGSGDRSDANSDGLDRQRSDTFGRDGTNQALTYQRKSVPAARISETAVHTERAAESVERGVLTSNRIQSSVNEKSEPEKVLIEANGLPDRETASPDRANQSKGTIAATVAAASSANPRATKPASSIESKSNRRLRKKRERRSSILGVLTRILLGLCVLIIAGIGWMLTLRFLGEKSMSRDAKDVILTIGADNKPDGVDSIEDDGRTIVYKGVKYRWNENLSTILFLGSDRTLEQQESRESVIGTNGQADTLILGIVDNQNKKISFININRDTMSYVSQYTPDGDYAGEKTMQICLAYSYGKDNQDSCRLTASAVSNFLYGIPVDAYCRLSYDSIPMLNDSIGGVPVKVLEEMTSKDPELVKDTTVTLKGKQALDYIRWRNHSVTNTNELRMARQKQYLYAFMHRTIDATRADITLPLGLYNNAKPYMTTDITPSRVTYLTSKVLEYGISDEAVRSIPGESVDGADGLVEFHQDDTALYEIILDTFYNEVK